MTSILDFELRLMSQMSAHAAIGLVLGRHGITELEMTARSEALRTRCSLVDGAPHKTYHAILQATFLFSAETPLVPDDSSFAHSTSYYYLLPTWQKTPLRINCAPRGNAWGISFVQDPHALVRPATPNLLDPWSCALDGVRSLYTWQEDDAWSDYQRDLYRVSELASAPRMLGTFDFGLLQDWREDVSTPAPTWNAPQAPLLDPHRTTLEDALRARGA